MATMPRQASTSLGEEQPGGFMPRRGSEQHLVSTCSHQLSAYFACAVTTLLTAIKAVANAVVGC